MPFVATWMGPDIIVSEIMQKKKMTSIKWNLIEMIQKNLFTKQKQTHRF